MMFRIPLNTASRRTSALLLLITCCSCLVAKPQLAWDGQARISGAISIAEADDDSLKLIPESSSGSGHVTINYGDDLLNLSSSVFFSIDAVNHTAGELDVSISLCSNPSQKWSNEMTGRFVMQPWENRPLKVFMLRQALDEDSPWKQRLGNLYAFPGGHQRHWRFLDAQKIKQVQIHLSWTDAASNAPEIRISKPTGIQELDMSSERLCKLPKPLVDKFGQLNGETWQGKSEDVSDLEQDGTTDYTAFNQRAVAKGLSTYGGLLDGPQLKATGKFRTEKLDDKWWLIDPDGHLFWSIGVTEAGIGSLTRIEDREEFFPKLRPQKDSDVWKQDRKTLSYSFYNSNLKYKYGKDWLDHHYAVTEGRMRAWGINTIGAWSMEPGTVFKHKKPTVPYTVIVHTNLNGGLGKLHHMVDPFSEQFEKSLDTVLKRNAKLYAGDPNNIGIFVNNELDWEGGLRLPLEVLGLYNYVPARRAMITMLNEHYGTIEQLNQAWGTNFEDFETVRQQEGLMQQKAFVADMETYHILFTEAYFSKSAQAVQKHYPGHLFLGSRFNKWSAEVTRAASKYCDVISFNLYRNSVADFSAVTDVDRPYLISEFHFGSGSHGVWGRGLTPCADADNQAELYRAYVGDAIKHPNFVGAHWFTWSDQPVTGRYDGENFRVGLVNIVDRPYPALIDSISNISHNIYQQRLTQ